MPYDCLSNKVVMMGEIDVSSLPCVTKKATDGNDTTENQQLLGHT